jgi:hypothetical protein
MIVLSVRLLRVHFAVRFARVRANIYELCNVRVYWWLPALLRLLSAALSRLSLDCCSFPRLICFVWAF